jgi:hypothetical protein
MNNSDTKLIVGTFGCELIEIELNLQAKTHEPGRTLIHGHYHPGMPTNEVWGMATFPGGK